MHYAWIWWCLLQHGCTTQSRFKSATKKYSRSRRSSSSLTMFIKWMSNRPLMNVKLKVGKRPIISFCLKTNRTRGFIVHVLWKGSLARVTYMYLMCTYRYRDSGAASRRELKIMEIDIRRREFMSNEADNKTPREFFRITSGLLVRYTRRSCMTRQKCPSGAHGRGENERDSPWYIAGLEKWFRRRGNRETPKCSLRFGWRRIAFPRVGRLLTRVRIHACMHVHTDRQTRLAMRSSPNGFGLHSSSTFASSIFVRLHTRVQNKKKAPFSRPPIVIIVNGES